MDRTIRKDAAARTMRTDLPEADSFLPPSRQSLLDLARGVMDTGPILLTGDAGIGKSWLVAELIRQTTPIGWLRIDLTPNDGPVELYRHLARGLGLTLGTPSRLDIADVLADRSADGERCGLVIDEAQNLALDVWEEVRVLLNRFGADDGFGAVILVGQTPLVRRFSTRPMAAIEARLAAHLHLRPFDVAEAHAWLIGRYPGVTWAAEEVEAIHRDAGGNPRRLIRRLAAIQGRIGSRPEISSPAPAALHAVKDHENASAGDSSAHRAAMAPPLTGPARPPLHFEENSIEVGWSADDPESSDYEDQAEGKQVETIPSPPKIDESSLAIHDHYAALQAWREWTSNQERQTLAARSDRELADAIDEAAMTEAVDPAELATPDRPSIRAEGYQHFAPFGQLFTRMAPVREP